ncbi:MAG: glycosyltransferase [Synechococcaceae bacterium WB8_1B_057]|nr:glycosyltransferase [Synechococcaceae bacterium WB6_1A_059]NDG79849.1 glycosyltransferase [Synechococcaceae bacterium WB8_1B_057]
MISTLHILSSPNKPVHILNRTDPFSIAIVKFIENMPKHDWNCVLYSIPGSQVDCEQVNCLPGIYNETNKNIKVYNEIAAKEIKLRKKPKDIIVCFHGWENQEAAFANNDLYIVEPSIGYDIKAVFAPFRVFTSYAQMHMYYGHKDMLMNPSWFDAVIPNAFTPAEFDYNENKENYILYFGRVIENKGIHIAVQATEKAQVPLHIAGPGSLEDLGYKKIPNHVKILGTCDVDQRRHYMKSARAIIGPTYYVEPFGNMIAEGYFSGTPAITTDWGGFTETVVQGVTGYRCREFKDFVWAIENINEIDSKKCYNFAMENYAEDIVHKKFDSYFRKVQESNFYRL